MKTGMIIILISNKKTINFPKRHTLTMCRFSFVVIDKSNKNENTSSTRGHKHD